MKRLYQRAAAMPAAGGGHGVVLDGRLVKTSGRRDLVVPSAALAAAVAAEWAAQHGEIRRETMPLTRLAGAAVDGSAQREAIVRRVAHYAGTDLVCYRASHPPALVARQQTVWQPLIDWAAERYGAPLMVTHGVIPAIQPAASLAAFAAAVAAQDDFALTALHAATAPCGSLVIALALLEGRLDAGEAFAASQLDESFQIAAWGEDAEQAERRAALAADIEAATQFMALLSRNEPRNGLP